MKIKLDPKTPEGRVLKRLWWRPLPIVALLLIPATVVADMFIESNAGEWALLIVMVGVLGMAVAYMDCAEVATKNLVEKEGE